jgi:hypothetical protein
MIERIKGILLSPKAEWDKIEQENTSLTDVFVKYVLILAAIPAIATFIGYSFIGYTVGAFGYSYTIKGIDIGVRYAIISYITSCASFFISTIVIDALATAFKSEKNINRSAQLVGYSMTAGLIAGILNILPMLGILAFLAGIYGMVILFFGLAKMKKTPKDQEVVYFVISVLTIIVTNILIGFILAAILIQTASAGIAF